MGRILAQEVPLFAGFRDLLKASRPRNKTIVSVVDGDETVRRLEGLIERVCGDAPGTGVLFALPVRALPHRGRRGDVMEISGILDPLCVKLDLEARGKSQAIGELITLAASAGLIADTDAVERAILAREALMSTGIGEGVALPHALIAGFERTVLAVGRSRGGIDFDSLTALLSTWFGRSSAPRARSARTWVF